MFADRVQATVTFDASGSYDPDGDLADLTYAWSDNQTTSPDIAASTEVLNTVRIDPGAISGTWTVTLTVTDADGNTAAVSRDVDVAETASLVEIPAVYAAIDNRLSCTPDGGLNWIDNTDTGVISVGARPDDGVTFGHAVFGTSDGKLLRTTDSCENVTQVHSVASVRFEAVVWDWRDPSRVWALDDDLVLYLSSDGGATWAVYDDIGNILGHASSIGKSIGLPGGGGVFVYGGTGANNPLKAFIQQVGFHNWKEVTFGGNLSSDLPATAANVAIVDATDKGDGSGEVIVMENADAGNSGVRPVYHRAATEPVQGGDYTRGTGFAAGDVDAAFVVGAPGRGAAGTINFIMAFHDRDCWRSNDGSVWTEEALVLGANFQFNHAIWGFAQTHNFFLASFYVAAVEDTSGQTVGIYKSTDEAQTWGLLRPATGFDTWPASAIGRQVAMGRSRAAEGRFVVVSDDAANAKIAWRSSSVAWSAFDTTNFNNPTALDFFKVRAFTDQLWFVLGFNFGVDLDTGEAIRTKDGGSSWDDVYAAPTDGGDTRLWQDFAMTTDGVLWGLTINFTSGSPFDHTEIWKSTDDGDSWTEVYDNSADGYVGRHLVAHPTDPNRILVYGHADATIRRKPLVIFSIDGGVSWNANAQGSVIWAAGPYTRSDDIKQLTSNRLVVFNRSAGDEEAWYTSDDNGATWTKRTTLTGLTAGVHRLHSIVGEASGVGLYSAFDKPPATSVEDSVIYQSLDGGVTWAEMSNFVPVLHFSHRVRCGLAYDAIEKALYTWGTGTGWAPNTDHVWKLKPTNEATAWEDVSAQLLPWGGDASYSVGERSSHGIAVIPRP